MSPTSSQRTIPIHELLLLVVGLVVMYLPTYITLDREVWNVVGQGHGPVILALCVWLAWQRWPALTKLKSEGQVLAGLPLLLIGLLLYVVGRSQQVLMLETSSQLLMLSGLLLSYWEDRG